jgi:drug/metabolite transporter (DMT)-like permease
LISARKAAIALNKVLGIFLKVAATLVFALMSLVVKWLSNDFPTGQLVFFRSAFALIPLMMWIGWTSELRDAFYTKNLKGHILRSLAGVGGMFMNFGALHYLSLPDATAITYITPLTVTVLGAVLLGETVRIWRWTAIGVGFSGVLIMLSPFIGASGGPDVAYGAMLGLIGTVFSAFASIAIRKLSGTEKTGAIVFYFSLITALSGLVTIGFGWTMPNATQFGLLVLAGFFGGIGQILHTASIRFAPVSVVAPFEYVTLIWATLFGYIVFGDVPVPAVLIGAGIVIAAGLFIVYRERQLGIAERRSQDATTD